MRAMRVNTGTLEVARDTERVDDQGSDGRIPFAALGSTTRSEERRVRSDRS